MLRLELLATAKKPKVVPLDAPSQGLQDKQNQKPIAYAIVENDDIKPVFKLGEIS